MKKMMNGYGAGIIILVIILIGAGVLSYLINHGKGGPYIVGVSNGYIGNNWRTQMLDDLDSMSQQYIGDQLIKEIIVKNAGNDVNNQILQIRYLIDSDVDLLLIDPNHDTMLNQVIGEAINKGIVVIVFDQNVENDSVYQVTIDHKGWGNELARWIIGEMGGKGNLLLVGGVEGQPCNELRVNGMMEAINQYPDIIVKDAVYGNWDQSTSSKVVKDALVNNPGIDGILCQDGMALGAVRAIESSGLNINLMTGEVMNAYITESTEKSRLEDFKTFALTNPPGVGATALSLGLYILVNDIPYEPEIMHIPHRRMLIDDGKIFGEHITGGSIGTYYYDEWYDLEEIGLYFYGDKQK